MRTLKLELLTTDHCSLCDAAFDLLLQLPELAGCELRTIDVSAEDAVFRAYADRIPVLRCARSELAWPFDAQQVAHWISLQSEPE